MSVAADDTTSTNYVGHNAPALGSGRRSPLTEAELDAKYAAYVERSDRYLETVREAGDQMWFDDPVRRMRAAKQLGIPLYSDATTVRRALWERGQK